MEDWCNRAAAELLAPTRELRARWQEVRRDARRFEVLARTFKVSPRSRRPPRPRPEVSLTETPSSISTDDYVNQEHKGGETSSGGDFYNNQNTRIGELFAIQVLRAALEGRIGFKEAYDLTGLRGGTFQEYARRLGVNLQ